MSTYITRVKISNADPVDYEKLDVEMEKDAFFKVTKPGEASLLIAAREYSYRGVKTLQAVVNAAYTAASRIGKQYSLTVIKEKTRVTA